MDGAIIAGFSILMVIAVACIPFMYSYYMYTKNRLFTKPKTSVVGVVISSILAAAVLAFGIFFATQINSGISKNCVAYLSLSFVLLAFSLGYLACFIIIPIINKKGKIAYDAIPDVDWTQKLKELEVKYGNIEAKKDELIAKHKKHYQSVLTYYQAILYSSKNKQIPIAEKIADIVTFNDAFTSKWSTKDNLLVCYLTYKYCEIIQNW